MLFVLFMLPLLLLLSCAFASCSCMYIKAIDDNFSVARIEVGTIISNNTNESVFDVIDFISILWNRVDLAIK